MWSRVAAFNGNLPRTIDVCGHDHRTGSPMRVNNSCPAGVRRRTNRNGPARPGYYTGMVTGGLYAEVKERRDGREVDYEFTADLDTKQKKKLMRETSGSYVHMY